MIRRSSRSAVNAFTLVELLVSLAITLVIAVLLISVVSGSLSMWQRGRNQIDTVSNARQVLTRISDELKGAIAATGRAEFSENVSLLGDSPAPVEGTSENVFFVAPYPNAGSGDLCVVAYRHNAATHELQRAFVKSDDAWVASTNRYRAAGYTSALTASPSPAQSPWRTVAQNVLEFELRSYSQSELDANGTPTPTWNSETNVAPDRGIVPRRIVVRLRVIDDKAVARLDASRSNPDAYNRILAQSSREFSADIDLLPPH